MLSIKNNSIIVSTKIFSLIAAVLLISTTVLAIYATIYRDKNNEVHRAVMLYDKLFMEHPSKEDFQKYLKEHTLTPVTGETIENVKKFGESLIEDELLRRTLQSGKINIFIYDGHYYYAYEMHDMYYYRSDEPMTPFKLYISLVAVLLLLLFIMFYRYMTQGIKPLEKLHKNIKDFSLGKKDIDTRVDGTDEVAQVANSFHDAVKKIEALEKSRSLFMRNVMHELKTPITKGKIMAVLLDISTKEKEQLNELFEQMQAHLNNLALVESLTAKNLELDQKDYALIDLIEQAIDMLDIDEKSINSFIKDEKIYVDFNLFSFAIKNLIDNAMKYTQTIPIIIKYENRCLRVINEGKELSGDFNSYLKAFARDSTYNSIEGMGLGLHITNEIVQIHGYKFLYEYKNGLHHFSICF